MQMSASQGGFPWLLTPSHPAPLPVSCTSWHLLPAEPQYSLFGYLFIYLFIYLFGCGPFFLKKHLYWSIIALQCCASAV